MEESWRGKEKSVQNLEIVASAVADLLEEKYPFVMLHIFIKYEECEYPRVEFKHGREPNEPDHAVKGKD